MKTLSLLAVLFVAIFMAIGAETETMNLDAGSGAAMVMVNSSEPPITPGINHTKPDLIDHNNGKAISRVNAVWYPLEERTKNPRIGGFGDQYEIFFRFTMLPTNELFATATLRLFVREHPDLMPKKIEVRRVTTADPLPIRKRPGESWIPERIRFSMKPTSEHFTTVTPNKNWIEIDITQLVKEWVRKPESNHGIHLLSTEHRNHWVHFNGPLSEENSPQLLIRKQDPERPVLHRQKAQI
jgi:hypothetical protein